ncbi:unnamed protein product, partial [Ectocarpus sp. 12 AP-2014]
YYRKRRSRGSGTRGTRECKTSAPAGTIKEQMTVAPSSPSFPKVVIVGAGMAGLSSARELLRRGWPKDKLVLLEASSRFGGR